jgi:hypothetical protein
MKIVPIRAAYVFALLVAVSFAWASAEHRRAEELKGRLDACQNLASLENYSMVHNSELQMVQISGHHVNLIGNVIDTLVVSPQASDVRLEANLIRVWKNPPLRLSAPPGVELDFGGNRVVRLEELQ